MSKNDAMITPRAISGNQAHVPPLGNRKFLERFTFVLPSVAISVFVLQASIATLLFGAALPNEAVTNSMIATAFVNAVAGITLREFNQSPGTRRFALILPSFILPVLFLTVFLLVVRLPYSNMVLLPGLASGLLLMSFVVALNRPISNRKIYLVPGTQTHALAEELAFLDVVVLSSPKELIGCSDGLVVADLRQDFSRDWERGIAHAVVNGVPVYHSKQLRETLLGRVQIEAMSENTFGTLLPSQSYLLLKRIVDFLGAAIALIVLAAPMVVIAIAIRVDSSGPALFRQRRMGYRGREFDTIKFRTMYSSGNDPDDLVSQKTLDEDPRVTRVGRFLRNSRLDELPQLINVLRNEMSLIGPRPEALSLSRWYDEHLDFYEYRHILRPGITGWAQVNQGHVTELDDVYIKLQYDFYYIKNLSAWLDLLIAFRTISVMLSWRGAR